MPVFVKGHKRGKSLVKAYSRAIANVDAANRAANYAASTRAVSTVRRLRRLLNDKVTRGKTLLGNRYGNRFGTQLFVQTRTARRIEGRSR